MPAEKWEISLSEWSACSSAGNALCNSNPSPPSSPVNQAAVFAHLHVLHAFHISSTSEQKQNQVKKWKSRLQPDQVYAISRSRFQ
jgi:hypothetical protein